MMWQTFDFSASVAIGALSTADLSLGISDDVRSGLTLVRVTGNLVIIPVAMGGFDYTFALGQIPTHAFDGGIIPDITTTQSEAFPWLWHRIDSFHKNANTADALTVPVDVRAQRRLRGDSTIFSAMRNRSSSSDSLVYAFSGRGLWALP